MRCIDLLRKKKKVLKIFLIVSVFSKEIRKLLMSKSDIMAFSNQI
jgi:hypothetical protein